MAKRRKDQASGKPAADEEPSPHLRRHMALLGLASLADYRAYCRQHGLPTRLDKTPKVLHDELEQVRLRAAEQKLQSRRRTRRPLDAMLAALESASAGGFDAAALPPGELRTACEALARLRLDRPHRTQLAELFELVGKRAAFLFEHETFGDRRLPYWRGLVALNDRRGQWLRPLDDWRPQSHNRRKQFAQLTRHLLADYHVPGFLDAAWLRDDTGSHRYRDLFVHVGRGGNPRSATLPVEMGKKVAHWFLQAPEHVSIEGAIRWGQVHALGGGPRLAEAIAATPLGREFVHEPFWQTVLAWFVQHPMLDLAQVGPIVDFLTQMKFRPTDVVLPDGRLEQRPPPQPGLTMARRNPEALLRQMERWHAALGGPRAVGPEVWEASGVGALRWETGLRNRRLWSIDELRTRKALVVEGRALGHCVASYAGSCAAARCSIWTVSLATKEGIEKRLTVELSRQRVIVQARGKHNRVPEPQELDVLRRWAEQEELTLATYL